MFKMIKRFRKISSLIDNNNYFPSTQTEKPILHYIIMIRAWHRYYRAHASLYLSLSITL